MGEAKRLKDRIAQETAQSEREKKMHLRAQRAEGDLLKAQAEIVRLQAEVERLSVLMDAWRNDCIEAIRALKTGDK